MPMRKLYPVFWSVCETWAAPCWGHFLVSLAALCQNSTRNFKGHIFTLLHVKGTISLFFFFNFIPRCNWIWSFCQKERVWGRVLLTSELIIFIREGTSNLASQHSTDLVRSKAQALYVFWTYSFSYSLKCSQSLFEK